MALNEPKTANVGGVDPRLVDIIRKAAGKYGLSVAVTPSGGAVRGERSSTSRHINPLDKALSTGSAIDIQLVDRHGNVLDNYQTPATFRAYERFAQTARNIQMREYPELEKNFRWGGYFGGTLGKTYGAMDLMHFDLHPTGAMGAGSWQNGLNADAAQAWGVADSVGMRDTSTLAGIGVDVLNDYGTAIPFPLTPGEVRPRPNPLGEEVRARVAELGFEGNDAVKNFQSANNLEANGIIAPGTIAAANAPNVVRADGRRQRANLFGREPHVAPAPLTGSSKPSGAIIRPRLFDPAIPIPRPRPDPTREPKRSGALTAPKTLAAANPSGRSVVDEIDEIRRKMLSDRRAYFANDALQARYRELVAMRERNWGF